MKYKQGQFGLLPIMITAGLGFLGVMGSAYLTAQYSVKENIAEVKADTRVLGERESNHYLELTKQISGLDKKLDLLLGKIK